MDTFICDYRCRTVGEGITKYDISDDWCAEFDAYDGAYPIVCIQVDQIREAPAVMGIRLRIVENEDEEYAGCMVFTDRKVIVFKIDYMRDLTKALETAMN